MVGKVIANKHKIIVSGLGVIGVLMILLGLAGGAIPPVLSGIAFLLITWKLV